MKSIDKLLAGITPDNLHAPLDAGRPVGHEIARLSATALKGMVRKPASPVTIAAVNAAIAAQGKKAK